MTLIKVKNRFVLPLESLARLVLRFVYDPEHMKSDDQDTMERSIVYWSKKVDITDDELFKLQSIGKVLKLQEEGKIEERKELFKEHDINWAKFHRLPELKELGDVIT